jgi:arabinose-5-phosphate isomerase
MDAIDAMRLCRSGCAIVTAPDGTLAGIFTQGDFTRAWKQTGDLGPLPVAQFMTRQPITIQSDRLAAEILNLLERHPVDDLVVVSPDNRPVGLVDTQDLTRLRLI